VQPIRLLNCPFPHFLVDMSARSDDAQQLLAEAKEQKDASAMRQRPRRGGSEVGDAKRQLAKRGRGRPRKPEHLRKTKPYVPSGRPRGRPKLPEQLKKTKPKPSSGRGRGRPPLSEEEKAKRLASKAKTTSSGSRGRPKKSE
jgi:hypothetical protein